MRNLIFALFAALLVATLMSSTQATSAQTDAMLNLYSAMPRKVKAQMIREILRREYGVSSDTEFKKLKKAFKKIGKGISKVGKTAFKVIKQNAIPIAIGVATGGVGGALVGVAKAQAGNLAMKGLNKVTKGKLGKFAPIINAGISGFTGGGLKGAGQAILKSGKQFAIDKAKEFGIKKLDKATKGKFSQYYGKFGGAIEAGLSSYKKNGNWNSAAKAAFKAAKPALIEEGKRFATKKLDKATKGKFSKYYNQYGGIVEAGISGYKNGKWTGARRAAWNAAKPILIEKGKERLDKATKGKFSKYYNQYGGIVEAGISGYKNGKWAGARRAAWNAAKPILIEKGKERLDRATKGKFSKYYNQYGGIVEAGISGYKNGKWAGARRAAWNAAKPILIEKGKERLDKATKGKFSKYYNQYGGIVEAGIKGFKNGKWSGARRAAFDAAKPIAIDRFVNFGKRRLSRATKGKSNRIVESELGQQIESALRTQLGDKIDYARLAKLLRRSN